MENLAEKQEKIECADCYEEFPQCSLTDTVNGLVCSKCLENYVCCADCDTYILREDARIINNGDYVCENCLDDNYSYCEDCEEYHPVDDIYYLDNYNRSVCDRCAERRYTECSCCGNLIENCDVHITHDGNSLCYRCYERNYFTCDNCGDIYHTDNMCPDCEYCADCCTCSHGHYDNDSNETGHINDYGYKPNPLFHSMNGVFSKLKTNKTLWLGIEFETEVKSKFSVSTLAQNVGSALGDFAYLKSDCSVGRGFEIVTHPATMDYHIKSGLWDTAFKSLIEQGHNDNGRCGIHVHVSRGFFNKEEEIKLGHFLSVFDERIYRIAQRKCEQFAAITKKKLGNLKMYPIDRDRYRALNYTNDNTLEFRIFKTIYDLNEFYSMVQFCDSLSRFVKTISIAELIYNPASVWDKYEKYISTGKTYKLLKSYFDKLEVSKVKINAQVLKSEVLKYKQHNTAQYVGEDRRCLTHGQNYEIDSSNGTTFNIHCNEGYTHTINFYDSDFVPTVSEINGVNNEYRRGDIVEILNFTDCGLCEGTSNMRYNSPYTVEYVGYSNGHQSTVTLNSYYFCLRQVTPCRRGYAIGTSFRFIASEYSTLYQITDINTYAGILSYKDASGNSRIAEINETIAVDSNYR